MGHESIAADAAGWVRRIRASWRDLTGGPGQPDSMRPTLVAVSGGADSAALAIALGTLQDARVVLGIVMHDLRPAELVHDDRRAVNMLASRLGVRWVCDHARVGDGNAEHAARVARYASLERMALETGCTFIATGHHAHDQLETLLLAICRGSGPAALRGVQRSRNSGTPGVRLVRPALAEHPEFARAVCEQFGYDARRDATNRDPARGRAWLRDRIVPELSARFPGLGTSLDSATSQLARMLEGSVPQDASDVGDEGIDA